MKKAIEKSNKRVKPTYVRPKIDLIGSLADLSQTTSVGAMLDGGSLPKNKKSCISAPPPIEEHRVLLSDKVCQNAYLSEIQKNIRPGDIVCDLGIGSGIHTLFALKAGAKKVYAIDIDPLIHATKEVIKDNGYEDQVIFINGNSNQVELPEKVDVLISNIGFMNTLNDVPRAIKKFLKPGGRAIPDAVAVALAPIYCPETFCENTQEWSPDNYGFNFSSLKKIATNYPIYFQMSKNQILNRQFCPEPISLKTDVPRVLSWQCEFKFDQDVLCHGLGGWYNFYANHHEYMSTRPPIKMSNLIWNNYLLPFRDEVRLKAGDKLKFNIEMHRELYGTGSVWLWSSELNSKILFKQSSFEGILTPVM